MQTRRIRRWWCTFNGVAVWKRNLMIVLNRSMTANRLLANRFATISMEVELYLEKGVVQSVVFCLARCSKLFANGSRLCEAVDFGKQKFNFKQKIK